MPALHLAAAAVALILIASVATIAGVKNMASR